MFPSGEPSAFDFLRNRPIQPYVPPAQPDEVTDEEKTGLEALKSLQPDTKKASMMEKPVPKTEKAAPVKKQMTPLRQSGSAGRVQTKKTTKPIVKKAMKKTPKKAAKPAKKMKKPVKKPVKKAAKKPAKKKARR